MREARQSTPKYKGLVIGCGLAGSTRIEGNHAECYQLHPQCELMGVFDKFTKSAQKAAQSHHCHHVGDTMRFIYLMIMMGIFKMVLQIIIRYVVLLAITI